MAIIGWQATAFDPKSQRQNRLERAHGRLTVVDLFRFRQFGIRNETRVLPRNIITFLAQRPPVRQPLRSPDVVRIFGESLGQFSEFGGKLDGTCINRAREIVRKHCAMLDVSTGDGKQRIRRELDCRPEHGRPC